MKKVLLLIVILSLSSCTINVYLHETSKEKQNKKVSIDCNEIKIDSGKLVSHYIIPVRFHKTIIVDTIFYREMLKYK
jgi:uncharacterized protein YceK